VSITRLREREDRTKLLREGWSIFFLIIVGERKGSREGTQNMVPHREGGKRAIILKGSEKDQLQILLEKRRLERKGRKVHLGDRKEDQCFQKKKKKDSIDHHRGPISLTYEPLQFAKKRIETRIFGGGKKRLAWLRERVKSGVLLI